MKSPIWKFVLLLGGIATAITAIHISRVLDYKVVPRKSAIEYPEAHLKTGYSRFEKDLEIRSNSTSIEPPRAQPKTSLKILSNRPYSQSKTKIQVNGETLIIDDEQTICNPPCKINFNPHGVSIFRNGSNSSNIQIDADSDSQIDIQLEGLNIDRSDLVDSDIIPFADRNR